MSQFDSYLRGWKERVRLAEEARRQREVRARGLLPKLVRHLVERFAARRVVLFGSLAEGWFGLHSDIDLAVEGIEGTVLFRAGAELDDLAQPIRVDLVPIEQAYPEVLERIEKRGEVLHAA